MTSCSFPSCFPNMEQALWLDGDTLSLADIGPLWDRGAGRHPVLAVQDPLVPFVSSCFGVAGYRKLGLRGSAKYFNAGVMLMNLGLWRQQQVSSRALEYLKRYARDVTFWDQEGLNAVLAGEWGELDAVWNYSVSLGGVNGRRTTDSQTKIVHFNGNLKPWRYDGRHSYFNTYYEYVDRTAWSGSRPAPRWLATVLRSYERSALRHFLYPTERFATRLWRKLTRRLATEEDVKDP